MLKTLQLRDLYLGDVDAKYELLMNSQEEKNRFQKSFLIPENIVIENFLLGKQFYITGLKGTGKTALLRYIGICAEKELGSHTSFILFKTQFSEDDKKDFFKLATATMIDKEELPEEPDYENIWRWFIHRHIVQEVVEKGVSIFKKDRDWEMYKTCVMAPKIGNEESGIIRKLPKLRNGTIELGASLFDIQGKLGLEFEFEDSNKSRVKFNSIVRQADNLFKKLTPDSGNLFVLIDELEISYITKQIYERDIRLIRDLIIAVEQFNTLCRQSLINIKIICAVRSEVISSISSSGKEINKPIGSFGVPVIWHQAGGDITKHPILKIIIQRIMSSEEEHNESRKDPNEVWERWFTPHVQGTPTTQYILHHTWYRPRDIIRLLNLAKNQFPHQTKFGHKVFDAIRKQYSTESWVEMAEELKATYSTDEIDGIRRLLYGFKPFFFFEEIEQRSNKLSQTYDSVSKLLDNHKLSSIIIHLFRIGIIGNITRNGRNRWAFRGDDEVILEEKLTVHRALWQHLSISN